ncbi:MAG: aminotransferase class I/II-fold pyridoxal phosphate-dependent enzyme [Chlamydiales bacterium]
MTAFLGAHLQKREDQGLLRSLQSTAGLVDLTSNDYFGFAKDCDGIKGSDSSGAAGSRLLTGNYPLYEEVEKRVAEFHRAESCLIYNSGYTANLGLLSALGTDSVTFLYDLEIHASMIDGIHLSDATHLPFKHNSLDSLERRLKKVSLPAFVLVESIYSMSGDFAPLTEIAVLCAKYGAHLIVDEAHATGIYGLNGEGLVAELGLESQVFARVHTFSKALGAHGACVLGSNILKQYLLNFSRPLIYTTALPAITLTSIESKYERLKREAQMQQQRLKSLITYFCKKTSTQNIQSPIKPIYISGVEKLRYLSQRLKARGLDVRAIVTPTVPRGRECLRVVLHSFNREEEIDQLVEVLL